MKFFLKNNKAFTLTELVVSSFILAFIAAWVFLFITDTFSNIYDSSAESKVTDVAKFQNQIILADQNWYMKKDLSENNYIILEKDANNHFLILIKEGKVWIIYWDYSNISNINSINLANFPWSTIDVEEAYAKEIIIDTSVKKFDSSKLYRFDFKPKWSKKLYSLYI